MTEATIRTAPDGGYGWVVCAVAFIISMVTDGILYSYGVIMPELMKAFQCSSSAAAAIGALQSGLMYFVAMIIFAVTNRIGCRYFKGCQINILKIL